MEKNKTKVKNIVLLIAFIAIIIMITISYGKQITQLVSEPDQFRDLILSYGYGGVLVFVLLQILQIVVAAIPGELFQVAGGYIYGAWIGTFYLVIGGVIGTVIAFYLARIIGFPLVKAMVSEENAQKINALMSSPKADIIVFILFIIPGLPKDVLTYVAGLTPMYPLKFFIISITARLPALFASAYIGANLQEQDYSDAGLVILIAVVLIAIGLWKRETIFNKIHQLSRTQTNKK